MKRSEIKNCSKQRLAQRGSFAVDSCDCGALHLTIGYITLRLEPRACIELTGALCEALDQLAGERRHTTLLS